MVFPSRAAQPLDTPRRRLEPVVVLVTLIAFGAALIGLGSRATYGAAVSGDEPYYLLTTGSLVSGDGLDISAAIDRGDFRAYHPIDLDQQSRVLGHGRMLSPHDPLLPALAAPAYAVAQQLGLQGWIGVKVFLALLGGLVAGVTAWVALHRVSARPGVVVVVVGGAFFGLPLSAYGSQVYPEMPAALAVIAAVALLSGSSTRSTPGRAVMVLLACLALPWLSIKYVPVAAVLGVMLLVRTWQTWGRRGLVGVAVLAGASAGTYLLAHQAWYGGWTVYAAGDHFVETGQLSALGVSPDYLGRSRRMVGLLIDSRFGIAVWSPIWLLLPAGASWLWRSRSEHRLVLLGPLVTGWFVATFIASTMHGWWVPGRQLVAVLPLGVVAIAGLVSDRGSLRPFAAIAALAGVLNWAWLAVESSIGSRALIVDFFQTGAVPYRLLAAVTPGGMPTTATVWTPWVTSVWSVGLVVSAVWLSRAGSALGSRHDEVDAVLESPPVRQT